MSGPKYRFSDFETNYFICHFSFFFRLKAEKNVLKGKFWSWVTMQREDYILTPTGFRKLSPTPKGLLHRRVRSANSVLLRKKEKSEETVIKSHSMEKVNEVVYLFFELNPFTFILFLSLPQFGACYVRNIIVYGFPGGTGFVSWRYMRQKNWLLKSHPYSAAKNR